MYGSYANGDVAYGEEDEVEMNWDDWDTHGHWFWRELHEKHCYKEDLVVVL